MMQPIDANNATAGGTWSASVPSSAALQSTTESHCREQSRGARCGIYTVETVEECVMGSLTAG